MLRGFGPSELALAREGLLLGVTVSWVEGCPKLQGGRAKSDGGDLRTAEGVRNPKVVSAARRSSDAPEGLQKHPKVTCKPEGDVVPSG